MTEAICRVVYVDTFRKPSSWRHPGGTVSETEETDLSECETDTGNERDSAERKGLNVLQEQGLSSSAHRTSECPMCTAQILLFYKVVIKRHECKSASLSVVTNLNLAVTRRF